MLKHMPHSIMSTCLLPGQRVRKCDRQAFSLLQQTFLSQEKIKFPAMCTLSNSKLRGNRLGRKSRVDGYGNMRGREKAHRGIWKFDPTTYSTLCSSSISNPFTEVS